MQGIFDKGNHSALVTMAILNLSFWKRLVNEQKGFILKINKNGRYQNIRKDRQEYSPLY